MSSKSNVGDSSTYEAGDQRNESQDEIENKPRYEEGKQGAHEANDPTSGASNSIPANCGVASEDERSIANRLAAAEPVNDDTSGKDKTIEQVMGEEDPTLPARMHGNEPSKGAKIDKQIQDEEAELIAKMDAKKKNK